MKKVSARPAGGSDLTSSSVYNLDGAIIGWLLPLILPWPMAMLTSSSSMIVLFGLGFPSMATHPKYL